MLRHSHDLCCFKSLLVTGLWDIILTSLLPPIQSCSSKFWVWSCIGGNFDKGWRGHHKHKIIDRPFMPKYGAASQVLLQLVASNPATATDANRQFVFQNPNQNDVTLPPLQTKPHRGTTPSLVIDNIFNSNPDDKWRCGTPGIANWAVKACPFSYSGNLGLKKIALIAMDRENNHTASKNKQSKYCKLHFIEHSSEYLSTWIFYLNSHTNTSCSRPF